MTDEPDYELFKERLIRQQRIYLGGISLLGKDGVRRAIALNKKTDHHAKSIDSETLDIIVKAIAALLAYFTARKSQKVIIQGKNGTKIEIPRGASKKEIDRYIESAIKLDAPQIIEPSKISKDDLDVLEKEYWHKLRDSS